MERASTEKSAPWIARLAFRGGLATVIRDIAEGAGAAGGVLVRSRGSAPLAVLPSAAVSPAVARYMTLNRPPDPRAIRVNPSLHEGFRIDQDDFSIREITRSPFYQEFLRPEGFAWHACALLGTLANGDTLHLSLKRELGRPSFAPEDLAEATATLQALREAVSFAREIADLPAPDDGFGLPVRRFLLGIDISGDALLITDCPGRRRLMTQENGQLQFVAGPRRDVAGHFMRDDPCCIVADADGMRWMARVRRLDMAGDLEASGTMLTVVSFAQLDVPPPDFADLVALLRGLFGLSVGEARIAALVGQGLPGPEIAARLELSPGTVRNHLKAIFQKTGTASQVELAVMLSRIEA